MPDVSQWTGKTLSAYVGGLSNPSKMPGYGYSLPAAECTTGSKLRTVDGSTCSGCYALKGRYTFSNVSAALYRRLESLEQPHWAEVMAELIRRKTGLWAILWAIEHGWRCWPETHLGWIEWLCAKP